MNVSSQPRHSLTARPGQASWLRASRDWTSDASRDSHTLPGPEPWEPNNATQSEGPASMTARDVAEAVAEARYTGLRSPGTGKDRQGSQTRQCPTSCRPILTWPSLGQANSGARREVWSLVSPTLSCPVVQLYAQPPLPLGIGPLQRSLLTRESSPSMAPHPNGQSRRHSFVRFNSLRKYGPTRCRTMTQSSSLSTLRKSTAQQILILNRHGRPERDPSSRPRPSRPVCAKGKDKGPMEKHWEAASPKQKHETQAPWRRER
ncbi:hypothetical protein BT67DRAFT_440568, partial [Trichocladium antarcticum]